MEKGLNFRTIKSQIEYFEAYEASLQLFSVLLHAASCGSTIWYKNIPFWSKYYRVYAIDLIGESSKSILRKKMKTTYDNAKWLDETLTGLGLDKFYLCGLSIGGWN